MEGQELTLLETDKIDNSIVIYSGASTLIVAEEEQKKLLASFDEEQVEIRPDGLIYLPQVFWRKRLNEAFGIGQWSLIVRNTKFDTDNNKAYLQGILMVRGNYVAEAMGEAEYHANNQKMSLATVWESAKSDCITRCCKDLSIASELWQPSYINNWKLKYAIEVWCEVRGQNKKQWRKKNAPAFWNEKNGQQKPQNNTNEQQKKTHPPKQEPQATPQKPTLKLWDGDALSEIGKQAHTALTTGKTTVEATLKKYSAGKEEVSTLNAWEKEFKDKSGAQK